MNYTKLTYDLNGSNYQPRNLELPTDSEWAIGIELIGENGERVELKDGDVKIVVNGEELQASKIYENIAIFQGRTSSCTWDDKAIDVKYKDEVTFKGLVLNQVSRGQRQIGGEGQSEVEWGDIKGQMNLQTDLFVALDGKATKEELGQIEEALNSKANNVDVTEWIDAVRGDVDKIEKVIPAQATEQNQLADKDFVNSSIVTNTAYFKGTYNSVGELPQERVTPNDYAFVVGQDGEGNTTYNRYKFTADGEWEFEYTLNNSSFTAQQWNTINSGLTSTSLPTLKSEIENEVYLKSELDTMTFSGEYDDATGGTFTYNLVYVK